VLQVLFVFVADIFQQLGAGEYLPRLVHRPWLGISLRVVDGQLEMKMPEVAPMEALRDMQRFGRRMAREMSKARF
jgi:hypothetical protein